jgi:hypothetical protein
MQMPSYQGRTDDGKGRKTSVRDTVRGRHSKRRGLADGQANRGRSPAKRRGYTAAMKQLSGCAEPGSWRPFGRPARAAPHASGGGPACCLALFDRISLRHALQQREARPAALGSRASSGSGTPPTVLSRVQWRGHAGPARSISRLANGSLRHGHWSAAQWAGRHAEDEAATTRVRSASTAASSAAMSAPVQWRSRPLRRMPWPGCNGRPKPRSSRRHSGAMRS